MTLSAAEQGASEQKALEKLEKLLDSRDESIALSAARTIYIDRLHANAALSRDASN